MTPRRGGRSGAAGRERKRRAARQRRRLDPLERNSAASNVTARGWWIRRWCAVVRGIRWSRERRGSARRAYRRDYSWATSISDDCVCSAARTELAETATAR